MLTLTRGKTNYTVVVIDKETGRSIFLAVKKRFDDQISISIDADDTFEITRPECSYFNINKLKLADQERYFKFCNLLKGRENEIQN